MGPTKKFCSQSSQLSGSVADGRQRAAKCHYDAEWTRPDRGHVDEAFSPKATFGGAV